MAENKLPQQVEFLQFHLPGMPVGDYTVEVEQTVESKQSAKLRTDNKFTGQLGFTVAGERILLKPGDIDGVFPPDGSLLDHSNILPHVSLTRSTLPWERNADASDPESPWLALLVFEEGEPFTQKTVRLSELKTSVPGFTIGPGENADDSAVVIDLPLTLLLTVLPSPDELKLLAHVRKSPDGAETAVVIANRIPDQGVKSVAHLVSLEGRYKKSKSGKPVFDGSTGVRLISLKSWSFSCLRRYLLTEQALAGLKSVVPAADFALLKNLQDVEVTGQVAFLDAVKKQLGKDVPATYSKPLLAAALWSKTFREVLMQLDRGALRLPPKGVAEPLLASGFVPLPHRFRNGEPLVSWYRGPLLPGKNTSGAGPGPARTADALVRYDPTTGLFDESCAAAWELGRLQALASKSVSTGLYKWKRQVAQQFLKDRQRDVHTHPLHANQPAAVLPVPPAEVVKWFAELGRLDHIPFGYLVPDEALLPAESIRFFQVDPVWMDCLFDGAFSIGRVTGQDLALEAQMENSFFRFPYRQKGLCGVLIRSELVAGWPGLFVEALETAAATETKQPLRRELFSKNILFCLFEGDLAAVEIHLKPETMHFGFDDSVKKTGEFAKKLRKADGTIDGKVIDPVPWRDKANRVVDMLNLSAQIKTAEGLAQPVTSDWFALEMIEGSVKVRFERQ